MSIFNKARYLIRNNNKWKFKIEQQYDCSYPGSKVDTKIQMYHIQILSGGL